MDPILKPLAIALLLCTIPALGTTEDFPLKRVPLLTYLVDYEASWSPDGRYIVLISSRHGGMKVHILDASSAGDGSGMRQITVGPDEDDSPAWSPDGQKIAYVSVHEGTSHICVMNTDGTGVRQLTSGAGQNIHPMWSPDSSRILFNTTHFTEAMARTCEESPTLADIPMRRSRRTECRSYIGNSGAKSRKFFS
jgi:dipeptidyl aminopeptidase/acylaminoacyl peptidase